MLRATRDQVLAFRAAALHLDRRLPASALTDAVRPVGLQDTPPRNAAVAAAARVDALTPEIWSRALEETKELVELWAMRGSPHVVAADDLLVFTAGLLPDDEAATLYRITSDLAPVVAESGVPALELVERLRARTHEVLDGSELTKRELGMALAPAVPEALRERLEGETAWGSYDGVSALALTVARIVAHRGAFLIAPRSGNELSLVRTDQWLGGDLPSAEPGEARAELVRRFLRAFGPATPEDLAWWATELTSDRSARIELEKWARRLWGLVEAELEEVEGEDGARAFVLAADAGRLGSPPTPDGVRLLPPHDPFLMLRDRETLVPKPLHPRVWRSQHSPGVVLEAAEIVATWKARKDGRRLAVTVDALAAALSPSARDAVHAEITRFAPLRGCEAVDVEFA